MLDSASGIFLVKVSWKASKEFQSGVFGIIANGRQRYRH